MVRAGIWSTRRHLVVALALPDTGRSRLHLRVDRTVDGRQQLAHYLARESYIEVVLPEPLHRFDAIADHLHVHGVPVWLAPIPIVDHVITLLDVRTSAHSAIAAALAQLPNMPLMRPALRPLPPPDERQLCLSLPRNS